MNIIEIIDSVSNVIHGKGATKQEIEIAEKKLNLKFADEYKDYLQNFGAVMMKGHSLTGISPAKQLDVVTISLRERELVSNIPENVYVIEHLGAEDIVYWQDENGTVYRSSADKFEKKYNSLAEYIDNEIVH